MGWDGFDTGNGNQNMRIRNAESWLERWPGLLVDQNRKGWGIKRKWWFLIWKRWSLTEINRINLSYSQHQKFGMKALLLLLLYALKALAELKGRKKYCSQPKKSSSKYYVIVDVGCTKKTHLRKLSIQKSLFKLFQGPVRKAPYRIWRQFLGSATNLHLGRIWYR